MPPPRPAKLDAMDVPAAAAGPWIALGAVVGILLLLAVRAIASGFGSGASPRPSASSRPVAEPRDDLAAFLDSPPGTPGAPDDDRDGWAPLAPAAPRPAAPAPAPAGVGSHPAGVLAALAVAALLLVGAAAALAASARWSGSAPAAAEPGASSPATTSPATGTPSTPPDPDAVATRLTFEGVVLEEHAVGITAAHPELLLTVEDGRAVGRLELPTLNCLATSAPPAPADPTCRPGRTEYADLSSPDLRVVRDGDELTVSGRVATSRRLPGGTVEETGRSYEMTVTVDVADVGTPGPAPARLEWGDQRVAGRADDLPPGVSPGG